MSLFYVFHHWYASPKGKKGEFGEALDLRFIVSNRFSSVVGGFKGARDNDELSNSKGGKELFKKIVKDMLITNELSRKCLIF